MSGPFNVIDALYGYGDVYNIQTELSRRNFDFNKIDNTQTIEYIGSHNPDMITGLFTNSRGGRSVIYNHLGIEVIVDINGPPLRSYEAGLTDDGTIGITPDPESIIPSNYYILNFYFGDESAIVEVGSTIKITGAGLLKRNFGYETKLVHKHKFMGIGPYVLGSHSYPRSNEGKQVSLFSNINYYSDEDGLLVGMDNHVTPYIHPDHDYSDPASMFDYVRMHPMPAFFDFDLDI